MKNIVLLAVLLSVPFTAFSQGCRDDGSVEIETLQVPGVSADDVIARLRSISSGLLALSEAGAVQVSIYLGRHPNDATCNPKHFIQSEIRRLGPNDFAGYTRLEAAFGRYYLNKR